MKAKNIERFDFKRVDVSTKYTIGESNTNLEHIQYIVLIDKEQLKV